MKESFDCMNVVLLRFYRKYKGIDINDNIQLKSVLWTNNDRRVLLKKIYFLMPFLFKIFGKKVEN
jgi:hypothetical protein